MFKRALKRADQLASSSAASSSWHEQVLSASNDMLQEAFFSRSVSGGGGAEDYDDGFLGGDRHDHYRHGQQHRMDDNVSFLTAACPQFEIRQGEDAIHMILRWAKVVVLKLARTYYALPTVLVILPLSLGLLIGFFLGRMYAEQNGRWQQQQQRSLSMARITQFARNRWFLASGAVVFCLHSCLNAARYLFCVGSDERSQRLSRGDDGCGREIVCGVDERVQSGHGTIERKQTSFPETREKLAEKENKAREDLRSNRDTTCESGVDPVSLPRHIAVVMDGNRRYGKAVYGKGTHGHWDGSRKLLEFAKWCMAERIKVLTVYAFSTENWKREPGEVEALMNLFATYCNEIRVEAMNRNIRVRVLSTETAQIPAHVKAALERLESDTTRCVGGLEMNICLSYGSRGEIVQACRSLARECASGKLDAERITEQTFSGALLSRHSPDPDILIRTSGEVRISNFLLWQLAYTELFFVDRHWPEIEKDDLLRVIRTFAKGRKRRFGK